MVRIPRSDACADGPVRTCVGCRKRTAKQELLRVVAGGSEHGPAVVPDPRGKAPGRGAYLHPTVECLELALRRRAFTRALRAADGLAGAPLREYLQQVAQQQI
ncbi:MAG: YlxR family protein [Nocardioidaceae bacterium]